MGAEGSLNRSSSPPSFPFDLVMGGPFLLTRSVSPLSQEIDFSFFFRFP